VVLWLKRRFSLFDKVLVFCQILNDEVLQAAKTPNVNFREFQLWPIFNTLRRCFSWKIKSGLFEIFFGSETFLKSLN